MTKNFPSLSRVCQVTNGWQMSHLLKINLPHTISQTEAVPVMEAANMGNIKTNMIYFPWDAWWYESAEWKME